MDCLKLLYTQKQGLGEICNTDSVWVPRFPVTTESKDLSKSASLFHRRYTGDISLPAQQNKNKNKKKTNPKLLWSLLWCLQKSEVVKNIWKEINKIPYTQVKSCQAAFTMQNKFDLQKCGIYITRLMN